jgi:hypothetical protein
MPDTPQSLTDLLDAIERLLVQNEPDWTMETCYFGIRFGDDTGRLVLRVMPLVEQARAAFEFDGNQFVAPKAHTSLYFRRKRDGTITDRTTYPRPQPDPPIESNETLPRLGDENYVWRGYGNNTRGIIKMRVGRFLADLNAPSVEEAERLSRRLAGLLRGEMKSDYKPRRSTLLPRWLSRLLHARR